MIVSYCYDAVKVHKRKAWDFYLLLVPHREALASPNPSETSNAEAHAGLLVKVLMYWLSIHTVYFIALVIPQCSQTFKEGIKVL